VHKLFFDAVSLSASSNNFCEMRHKRLTLLNIFVKRITDT